MLFSKYLLTGASVLSSLLLCSLLLLLLLLRLHSVMMNIKLCQSIQRWGQPAEVVTHGTSIAVFIRFAALFHSIGTGMAALSCTPPLTTGSVGPLQINEL